VHNFTL